MTKENHFSSKMADKSEAELRDYVDNREKFQEAAVQAAIWELEKRELAGEDIKELEKKIEQEKVIKKETYEKEQGLKYITDDPNAPLIYRDKFITVFGVLFSVLAGGILIAINFSKLGKRNLILPVIFVSLIYTILQGYLLSLIDTTGLTFVFSFLGMFLLENLFWKKHVDKELQYRKRPIWGAIIVALVFWVPIIYLNIIALQYQ